MSLHCCMLMICSGWAKLELFQFFVGCLVEASKDGSSETKVCPHGICIMEVAVGLVLCVECGEQIRVGYA